MISKSRCMQRQNTSMWNKDKAVLIRNKSGFVIGDQLSYP